MRYGSSKRRIYAHLFIMLALVGVSSSTIVHSCKDMGNDAVCFVHPMASRVLRRRVTKVWQRRGRRASLRGEGSRRTSLLVSRMVCWALNAWVRVAFCEARLRFTARPLPQLPQSRRQQRRMRRDLLPWTEWGNAVCTWCPHPSTCTQVCDPPGAVLQHGWAPRCCGKVWPILGVGVATV